MTIEFHKKKQSPSLFQKQTVEFEVSYFLQWVDRKKIQHEPALLKQAVDDLIVRFAQQLNASFYRSAVKKGFAPSVCTRRTFDFDSELRFCVGV